MLAYLNGEVIVDLPEEFVFGPDDDIPPYSLMLRIFGLRGLGFRFHFVV